MVGWDWDQYSSFVWITAHQKKALWLLTSSYQSVLRRIVAYHYNAKLHFLISFKSIALCFVALCGFFIVPFHTLHNALFYFWTHKLLLLLLCKIELWIQLVSNLEKSVIFAYLSCRNNLLGLTQTMSAIWINAILLIANVNSINLIRHKAWKSKNNSNVV